MSGADEIRYLVLCGFCSNIEHVVGPFKTESDAMLAVSVLEQMPYKDTESNWGEGDTWLSIEERRTVTL